ncbi:MAG: hypothetical protein RJA31_315 [Actinomycetota bacterium]
MTWPVPSDGVSSVVTVGKFDGVHRGHREVIAQLIGRADGRRVVVVTFDRHPLSVVDPGRAPAPLLSTAQKVEQLEAAGADLVVVVPFTEQFRELSPEGFVRDILVDGLSAGLVLVGEDFRYGRDGLGTIESLRDEGETLGFDVAIIGDVCVDESSVRISSSSIRAALSDGDVELAAHLLGRPHSVRGEVVHGHQRGRDLGFPTVNLEEASEGFVPLPGVYAGTLEVGGERYVAGISVGMNPTFDDVDRPQVEAHALDAEFDAYGQVATIAFTHRLRDSLHFSSIDELMRAMDKDIADVRVLVAEGQIQL